MEAENHLLKKDAAIAQVSLPGEVFMHERRLAYSAVPSFSSLAIIRPKAPAKAENMEIRVLV
ncbi:hypothetical protein LCM00_21570 [Bacillus infantis]|uniref:hypothetical protein n=1 Tax=Bacillus infantis TaxID=324767 RepID=UPI001CD7F075|nr:hypothetical protein [Bacillus infantis]MCA1042092.1 hypothetical protein [Bacillus infantis]